MAYRPLGSKVVTAVKDTTGLNPGNWTNIFDAAVLGAKVSFYELYTAVADQVPQGATVLGYVGTRRRTGALLAGTAEWDPSQPMLLVPTDEVYFCWSIAASGIAPIMTVWLRYDPTIQPSGEP